MADNPGENVATVLLHCEGTATVALWGGSRGELAFVGDHMGLNVVGRNPVRTFRADATFRGFSISN